MSERGVNFLKDGVIAVLLAYFVAKAIPWVDARSAVCAGFMAAEMAMFYLTAYDEIVRQRRRKRKK